VPIFAIGAVALPGAEGPSRGIEDALFFPFLYALDAVSSCPASLFFPKRLLFVVVGEFSAVSVLWLSGYRGSVDGFLRHCDRMAAAVG
jgi:hypothetical protein